MTGQLKNRETQNKSTKLSPVLWTSSTKRMILYADIMGFTERVYSQSFEDLRSSFSQFIMSWRRQMTPFLENTSSAARLRVMQFSDTFLVVVDGEEQKMFNLITRASECLIHVAMKKGFPIKGVIAAGEFYFNEQNQSAFGKPLVEADLLYKQIKYYGIVVHHSAEAIIKKYIDEDHPYCNTKIPLEKGYVSHYHLCWNLVNQQYKSCDNTNQCVGWLDSIAETVSGDPRKYIDATKEVFKQDAEDYKNNALVTPSKES